MPKRTTQKSAVYSNSCTTGANQMTTELTNQQIREIALANGFKLQAQTESRMDLNPYVYDFARALLAEAIPKGHAAAEKDLLADGGLAQKAFWHAFEQAKCNDNMNIRNSWEEYKTMLNKKGDK